MEPAARNTSSGPDVDTVAIAKSLDFIGDWRD